MRLLPSGALPPKGAVRLAGDDLLKMPYRSYYEQVRGRKIAMIVQDARAALNPVFPVGRQLHDVYRRVHGSDNGKSKRAIQKMISRVMLPNPNRIARSYPHELSGGMCQRVVVAMALIASPLVIISDEPTTGLDTTIQVQILALIKEIVEQHEMTQIFISHDVAAVANMCEQVAVMYCGRIVEIAETAEILDNPRHPYTRGLVGCFRAPDSERMPFIPGFAANLHALPKGCAFVERCSEAGQVCHEIDPQLLAHGRAWVACHMVGKEEDAQE